MRATLKILAIAVVTFFATEYLPGILTDVVPTAMMVSLALALFNAVLLRPLVIALNYPFTVISVGIFMMGINTILVKLADHFIDGFTVNNWISAALLAFIITVTGLVLDNFLFRKNSFN
jgi:putative membrane protein